MREDISSGEILECFLDGSAVGQLPTLAEADDILSRFLVEDTDPSFRTTRESQWRNMVLKCLRYGLMKPSSSSNRVEQTVSWIMQAMRTFRQKAQEAACPPTAAHSPERIMIDAIWFLSTVLYRDPATNVVDHITEGNAAQELPKITVETSQLDSSSSYSLLCRITNGIVMGFDKSTVECINVPFSLLLSGLEPIHLASAGFLSDSISQPMVIRSNITRDYFIKQFSKFITNLYYKQTNANLMLTEETEGFSKLLLLFSGLPETIGSVSTSKPQTTSSIDGMSIHETGQETSTFQYSSHTKEEQTLRTYVFDIMGTFKLAPIRVLDLTLDALESHILTLDMKDPWTYQLERSQHKSTAVHLLIDIIKMYPCENVAHLLGFKLWSYASLSGPVLDAPTCQNGVVDDTIKGDNVIASKTNTAAETCGSKTAVSESHETTAPKSLYIVCALLISNGIPLLKHLLPHLQIDFESILKEYEQKQKDEITRIRKIGVVSLNASAASTTNTVATSLNTVDEGGVKKETGMLHPTQGGSAIIPNALKFNNQFLDLLLACLEAKLPWDDIRYLFGDCESDDNSINMMDKSLEACCFLYPPIGKGLCDYMDSMLDDLYTDKMKIRSDLNRVHHLLVMDTDDKTSRDQVSSSSSPFKRENTLSVQTTLLDMARALFRPLRCVVVASSIALHPILYSKILRLVHSFLMNGDPNNNFFDQYTHYLLGAFLVPSLCLFPFNTALSAELWSVLAALSSYPIRYSFYGSMRSSGLEKEALKNGVLRKPLAQIQSEVESGKDIRYILRRVSMENVREMGRQIAKIANTNPLVVFTAILNQIESYDNLIFLMVDTFEFLTTYSLDVLGYCILISLGGGDAKLSRMKTKDDGITTAQWLSSLASFVGALYRKFPDVEVHGLLSYLLKKLSEGSVVELCVLQSLLKTAGGYGFADCSSIASLSPLQIAGRCGSLELRRETSDFGVIEQFDPKSSSKLRYALQSTNFGAIFLILLSQIRYKLLTMNTRKIKLIGNALDSCQRTSYLLLTFITDCLEERSLSDESALSSYAKTLPNPQTLFHMHGLEPEIVWRLSRPIFRRSFLNNPSTTLSSFIDCETVQNMLSDHCKQSVSPILYNLFFALSIYDITCPEDQYQLEITRLNREIDRLTKLQKGGKDAQATISALAQAAASAGVTGRELKDATSFTKAHEYELLRMNRVVDTLSTDLVQQKSHVERIHKLLDRDKSILFKKNDENASISGMIQDFISECVSPRCRSSPDDAIYCSKFPNLLHNLDTPNFHLLFYYNTIVESVNRIIFGVTEDEASNFAIFLEETWGNIHAVRFDPVLYSSEIQNKIGSCWPMETEVKSKNHGDFVVLYKQWHDSLATVLLGALKASEYMYCRAALLILSRLVKVFPTNAMVGKKLMKALARFQATDFSMQDIKAMAQGYKSQLSKARDEGLWKEDVNEKSYEEIPSSRNQPDEKIDSSNFHDTQNSSLVQSIPDVNQGNLDSSSNQLKDITPPVETVSIVHEINVADYPIEQPTQIQPTITSTENVRSDIITRSNNDEKCSIQVKETVSNGEHVSANDKKESVSNTNRVANLEGRWEKAHENRRNKRKEMDQKEYEPRRNQESVQQHGRQQRYRRSY